MTKITGMVQPEISSNEALDIAKKFWGISGTIKELGSQQDKNYLINNESNKYVLKITNTDTPREEIEKQNKALKVLESKIFLDKNKINTPVIIKSINNNPIEVINHGSSNHAVRLLNYVEGLPLIEEALPSSELLYSWGVLCAKLSEELKTIDYSYEENNSQWKLENAPDVIRQKISSVKNNKKQKQILKHLKKIEKYFNSFQSLEKQLIHADLTDDNLVYSKENNKVKISGIIDFGDVMHSWRVSEIAVAITGALHHHPDNPFKVVEIIKGYNSQKNLTKDELAAIWPLVILRGAVLVVSGQEQAEIDPHNEYAIEALGREWQIFNIASKISPAVFNNFLLKELSLKDDDEYEYFNVFNKSTQKIINFSVESTENDRGKWLDKNFKKKVIKKHLKNNDLVFSLYGEAKLYRSARQIKRTNKQRKYRAISTALEIYSSNAGISLYAPCNGFMTVINSRICEFSFNKGKLVFSGLEQVKSYNDIREGEEIATLAKKTRVWFIPSHTSDSEIVSSVMSETIDKLPKYCTENYWNAYKEYFNDPAKVLGIIEKKEYEEIENIRVSTLDKRLSSYSELQHHYYDDPPQIERGWKEYLIDTKGNVYIDMVNNVAMLGHGHPKLADSVYTQMLKLNTNSRFHYGVVADFCEEILKTVPDNFDTVLLVNSGSEAVDLALRIAMAATNRKDIICVEESYHGWTLASDAVSTSISDNPLSFQTRPEWVHALPAPNSYRGKYRGDDSGIKYASELKNTLSSLSAKDKLPAAFIAEPRNGNAGAIGIPKGFLNKVYEDIRAVGALCISDEVQVGYGRQGKWFWGFEEHSIVPDIITVAKAMGNGHPLGAVITSKKIADRLAEQGSFFSSAGGSTLSSLVALNVLKISQEEKLQENALNTGNYLKDKLEKLKDKHQLIGMIHGEGLYLGVELVENRTTLEPASYKTSILCSRMRELGVIVLATGDRGNVLKVKPPLCFTKESADYFVAMLDKVLKEII